jgi:cytochrome c-type biogenesis protein CcmH
MRVLALVLALLTATPAFAVLPGERLADPRLEERARALSQDLRCMVCQNQSIDDSDAPLARDLRVLVRERLTAGDSDRQVVDFLVSRYGEFVLLRPRFGWHTAVLWGAPALFLIGGVGYLLMAARRRRSSPAAGPAPLTDEEKAKLAVIVGADQPGRT